MLAQAFADDVEPARQGSITKGPVGSRGNGERMVAIWDFSRLESSLWALANAPAMAQMVSLERCIGELPIQEVKADGTGFGPLGPQAMAGSLLGVFRHQLFRSALAPSCSW